MALSQNSVFLYIIYLCNNTIYIYMYVVIRHVPKFGFSGFFINSWFLKILEDSLRILLQLKQYLVYSMFNTEYNPVGLYQVLGGCAELTMIPVYEKTRPLRLLILLDKYIAV